MLFAVLLLAVPAFSQYDDIYYNPDTDADYYGYNDDYRDDYRSSQYRGDRRYANERRQQVDQYYTADEYDYYNDYDFYYTSRIRRFHRPMYGFGYFDPVYVDAYYYDPFLVPGSTVLIYDDFFSYRDWVRWRNWRRWGWNSARFNRWDWCFTPGFNNFGWGGGLWGNRWFTPGFSVNVGIGFNNWGFNNWGFNNWGFNNWGPGWGWGNPWFNAYQNPFWGGNRWAGNYNWAPGWGGGNDYNRDIYYGPRTGGSATGPATGIRNRSQDRLDPGRITDNRRTQTDTRRDIDQRTGTRAGERIRTGRVNTDDRRRATTTDRTRIDRNRSTRTVEPRTRTRTIEPRTRTRTGSGNTSTRRRTGSGNDANIERRQLGGQMVPIDITPRTNDRMERYRRPSRSGAVPSTRRARESSRSYPNYNSRGRSTYDRYRSSRSSRSRSIRSRTPSRNRSSMGSSRRSSSRSSMSRSRSSSSSRARSSRSSSSRSRSGSGGRSRGGGNQ